MAGTPAKLLLPLLACIATLFASNVQSQAPYKLPPLTYPYNAIEPYIDTETMMLHHGRHHNASVTNLNRALTQVPKSIASLPLTRLLARAGMYGPNVPRNVSTAIRNNGGSHFNHAIFWKTLRPTNSSRKNAPSGPLSKAIRASFGNLRGLNDTLSNAASRLFGSGWAWLCYKPKSKNLTVVTTPNQDNPIMRYIVPAEDQCIPILGIDVWEHAYYLKHRNLRNAYIADWWKAINWPRVSKNYAYAVANYLDAIWR